jgi:hypothetical protein
LEFRGRSSEFRVIELAKIAMVYGVCNLVHVPCRLT